MRASNAPSYSPEMTLAIVERETILAAVKHTGGNRTQAARNLGISMSALRYKLKAYEEAGFKAPPSPKLAGSDD